MSHNACSEEHLCSQIGAAGGITHILSAMKAYKDEFFLQQQGLWALDATSYNGTDETGGSSDGLGVTANTLARVNVCISA